jgi:cation diffusion facilitator family transporter
MTTSSSSGGVDRVSTCRDRGRYPTFGLLSCGDPAGYVPDVPERDPGLRANVVGLVANVLLAVAKFVVGAAAGSAALVADAFNSAGDVIATAIGLAGYRLGRVPPDENHPYGHGNAESVAGLVIGAILLATGVFVGLEGARALLEGTRTPPEPIAAAVALTTAAVKAVLARYTTVVGRRMNSPALLASAADHRADVLIAIVVTAGIVGARLGAPWLDPLAALVVGVWIVGLAVAPIRSNFGVLMDESPPEVVEAVRRAASAQPGVLGVTAPRVHPLGSYYVVDLSIRVDGELSVRDGHALAHATADRIRQEVPHVQGVTVHVEPDVAGAAAAELQ